MLNAAKLGKLGILAGYAGIGIFAAERACRAVERSSHDKYCSYSLTEYYPLNPLWRNEPWGYPGVRNKIIKKNISLEQALQELESAELRRSYHEDDGYYDHLLDEQFRFGERSRSIVTLSITRGVFQKTLIFKPEVLTTRKAVEFLTDYIQAQQNSSPSIPGKK